MATAIRSARPVRETSSIAVPFPLCFAASAGIADGHGAYPSGRSRSGYVFGQGPLRGLEQLVSRLAVFGERGSPIPYPRAPAHLAADEDVSRPHRVDEPGDLRSETVGEEPRLLGGGLRQDRHDAVLSIGKRHVG